MSPPVLTTKLYIPRLRHDVVPRPSLMARLEEVMDGKIGLVSAPAGFGKTTLVAEWIASRTKTSPHIAFAWLTLEKADSDPVRFLTYLIVALQTVVDDAGQGLLTLLQSPQPPPLDTVLASLINEVATIPQEIVLVLDDYHLVEARAVDEALAFLIDHLPPTMHLLIVTREDPQLPLSRLRARDELTEVRLADLRFTVDEATQFLRRTTDSDLSPEDVTAITARTEGWITGLQLAAISMRDRQDTDAFIASFTGSHRFILDYLIEEVLERQPQRVQDFLLKTAVLDRLTGSLCDAVTDQRGGRQTLEYLEHANLFVIPLDTDRRWYRYHHLFADLLRQQLRQSATAMPKVNGPSPEELHRRASVWYESQGMQVEAFRHAVAAEDINRAARLLEGDGTPLQYRGATAQVLQWLGSLPTSALDARPGLWVNYASAMTIAGQPSEDVEVKLAAAESALAAREPDTVTEDLVGRIATIRAMQAINFSQADVVVSQARLALSHLAPDNLLARTAASWTLGYGYQLQGNRAAARQMFEQTLPISTESGNLMITIGTTVALGQIHESENRLREAETQFLRVLELTGDPPLPFACAAHFGLARLAYEWDDLDAAEDHVRKSLALGQQLPNIDTPALCKVLLARIQLAQGDLPSAARTLTEAEAFADRRGFAHLRPEIAEAQVLLHLKRGDIAGAAQLVKAHDIPFSGALVYLARGDHASALHLLASLRRQTEATATSNKHLRVIVLEAVTRHAAGATDEALRALERALAAGESEGLVRTFIDSGPPMVRLLSEALERGIRPAYTAKLLTAAEASSPRDNGPAGDPRAAAERTLIDPLSERELEVLRLIAEGLTNRQISERLFIALSTVKGHNQRIYGKLQVRRRTEAVARAHELGLI